MRGVEAVLKSAAFIALYCLKPGGVARVQGRAVTFARGTFMLWFIVRRGAVQLMKSYRASV